MKLTEIQELIKFVAKAGVSEVEIEDKDFKITIKSTENKKRGKATVTSEMPTAVIQQPMPMAIPQVAPVMPQQMPQSVAPSVEAAAPKETKAEALASDDSKYITIKSPMIGTFYRSSSPDKSPFVNVGDSIEQGQVVCIVEAMKLFNEIEAEVSGTIVKVLVDDTSPIEYDQPLFLIDPS